MSRRPLLLALTATGALTRTACDAGGLGPAGAVEAPVQAALLPSLAAQSTDIELVGDIGESNLEQIAALEPDLILGSDVRVEDLDDALTAIAPTVSTDSVDAADLVLDELEEVLGA